MVRLYIGERSVLTVHQVTSYGVHPSKLVEIHHLKTCNVPDGSDPGGRLQIVNYTTWISLESIQALEVEYDATEEKPKN